MPGQKISLQGQALPAATPMEGDPHQARMIQE